jgi:uncharacterized protein (TIGR03435 family)
VAPSLGGAFICNRRAGTSAPQAKKLVGGAEFGASAVKNLIRFERACLEYCIAPPLDQGSGSRGRSIERDLDFGFRHLRRDYNDTMRRPEPLIAAILLVGPLMSAEQPKFETASVKPADRCSLQNRIDPNLVTLNGDPLNVVLAEAYKVKMDQILGPSWLDADCFVIVAKIPEGATRDQVPAMLQAMLIDRFKLAAHTESRPTPGYALLVDKKGPKFKESDPNSPSATPRGQVTFGSGAASSIKGSMTMASFVRFLSRTLAVPVEDLTGLNGKYDIDISWARDRDSAKNYASTEPVPEASLPAGPDIFTAFRDSLGLRLERRKEQTEVLVIDHIDRIPTEN